MTLLTVEQCKMARAALGWSIADLAQKAQVSTNTVVRLESGATSLRPRTVMDIRRTLEDAGIEFIDENGGGAGVRMKKG